MNWKNDVQLQDLDPDQVLEFTCRQCGHIHIKHVSELQANEALMMFWMDQIEQEEVCHNRDCHGRVLMSIYHNNATSGFVGGLA